MSLKTASFFYPLRAKIVLFLLTTVFIGCTTVPYTGRSQLMLIAPQEEMAMGYKTAQEIEKKEPLSHDSYYNNLVKRVGYRIAKAANKPDYRWEFHVIDKPKTVNAFCLPGGKIFVYTGLFKYARDEAELASVIGHEVAHALARHGAERMSMVLLAQLGEAAALVAMGNQSEETQVAFLAAFGVITNLGVLLPYSRTHEYEADRIGLILMALAGYDPHAALSFWKKMAQLSKGETGFEFLSTHPTDANRIAQIRTFLPVAMKYYKPAG